ncbi:MAG: hypothetical protein IKB86_01125 [Clostridia bacterium]|nr:hypothetical protein [Clostridia bacterium]
MKKIITLLLAVAIVFSMATTNFNVNAEIQNFYDMETMDPVGIGAEVARKTVDGETVFSGANIAYRYYSLGFDILPAIKAALGDEEEVEVTLAFEIHTKWAEGFEGRRTSAKPIMRVRGGSVANGDADAWNSAYEDALDGSDAIFKTTDGVNIIGRITTKRVALNDEGWSLFTLDLYLTKAQIECAMTSNWTFCFDEMNGAHQPKSSETKDGKLILFEEVLIKNIGIYYTEEYVAANTTPEPEATATPIPTATPEPENNDGDAVEPTATATPVTKPTATAANDNINDNTNKNEGDDDKAGLPWIWIAIGAVVVVGAVVAVVVITSKKAKAKDKEETVDTPEE